MSPVQTLENLLSSPVAPHSRANQEGEVMALVFAVTMTVTSIAPAFFAPSAFSKLVAFTPLFLLGAVLFGVGCGFGFVFVIQKLRRVLNQKRWEVEFNDYRAKVCVAYKAAKPELFSTRLDLLYQFAQQLKPYIGDQEARAISAKVQEYKKELLLRKRNLIKKIDELVQSEREICLRPQGENVFVLWNDHRGSGANTTTITVLLKADADL